MCYLEAMKPLFAIPAPRRTAVAAALAAAAACAVFRGVVPDLEPWGLRLAGEGLFFLTVVAWAWAGGASLSGLREQPLPVMWLLAATGASVLILFSAFASQTFATVVGGDAGAALRLAAVFLLVCFSVALGLALAGMRSLFVLKKTRQPGWFFEAMLGFFILAYFAPLIYSKAVPFFTSSAICFMLLNSFRVKWIAFLVKKQKKTLAAAAGLALGVFMAGSILIFNNDASVHFLAAWSPGLWQLGKLVLLYGACYSGVILAATLFHLPTADAYDRKAEEFASLVDLSQSITGAMEFGDLADKVTSVTAHVCHGDFSWLLIQENNDFVVPSAFNVSVREARELSMALLAESDFDRCSVKVFRDKKLKIRIQNDALSFSFRSLAIAPLRVKNRTTGYLFLAIKKDSVFEPDDIRTVEAFAGSAAMALENARMLETRLEKERLLKELEVARVMQRRLLPISPPRGCGADVAVYFAPAYEVGGDYYDFFPMPDRRLGFVIADVSGKGLSAAFIMAELKGVFESLAGVILGPKQLLAKANGVLRKSLEKNRFVSASFGLLDPQAMTLCVARAGHMPFFVSSSRGIENHRPGGLVLGVADEPAFSEKLQERCIALHSRDAIVFITDGISEARNLSGGEFGYARLQGVIQACGDASAETLARAIVAEVKAFANQPVQYDDITLLVIKMD
jgi:serine phosphatase RsbU (regulator of sigma subunit)